MGLFQAALDTCLDSPFFASLSVHGLHFTVYAPSKIANVAASFADRLPVRREDQRRRSEKKIREGIMGLAHQNRTIAIASGLRVDGAKSQEIPQKEGVSGSEIATRNRLSHPQIAMQHCCVLSWKSLAISGVRYGHDRNRKNCKNRCHLGAVSSKSLPSPPPQPRKKIIF